MHFDALLSYGRSSFVKKSFVLAVSSFDLLKSNTTGFVLVRTKKNRPILSTAK